MTLEESIRANVVSGIEELLPTVRSIVREELARAAEVHPDTLLSVAETAERLHISEAAVLKAISRKGIKAHRVGRRWRIRLGDLLGEDAGRYHVDLDGAAVAK